jgi:LDH2 family malate/lactate/ureidoglycolate dehydrogenase
MIDAEAFSPQTTTRIAAMAERINDDGARLPGAGRIAKRQQVERDGLTVSQQILDTLDKLVATPV